MQVEKVIEEVQRSLAELKSSQKESVEKSVDSLLQTKINKITDDIALKLENVQKFQDAEKKRMDEIETMLAKSSLGGDSERKDEGKAALNEYMKKGTVGGKDFREIEIKAARTDSDPAGGYLVRPQFAEDMSKVIFETSPIYQLADVERGSSDTFIVDLDDEDIVSNKAPQGGSGGSVSTPEIGQITISTHKMDAEPKATLESLEDPVRDMEGWLKNKVSDKFARKTNTWGILGTGVGEGRGILSYPAAGSAYERGKIQQVVSGAAGEVTMDGFIELQSELKEDYQANAHWLMNRKTFGKTLQLKSNENYHLLGLQPNDRGGYSMFLLDKPLRFASDMPAPDSNSLSVAYGDFKKGFLFYEKAAYNMIRDPFTQKGWVVFYFYHRVGCGVQNFEAIKLLKCANS